jgi:PEP-CTERM motif
MGKKLFLPLVAIVAVALSPPGIAAESTCANVFDVCVDFGLVQQGDGTWVLTTTYVSSPSGILTATGIYYNAGKNAPDFGIGNVTVDLAGWTAAPKKCNDLSLSNGSTDLLNACGSTTKGINGGLGAPAGVLKISFTANSAFATALNAGQFDYRAHIQGYVNADCSIKVDTGVQGFIGSSSGDCSPTSTVPEPASFLLLGTGLLGLGGALRMRRGKDVVNA